MEETKVNSLGDLSRIELIKVVFDLLKIIDKVQIHLIYSDAPDEFKNRILPHFDAVRTMEKKLDIGSFNL